MIIPSILEKTTADFAHKLAKIKTIGKVPRVQVDFCDELFVPSHTLQVEDIGHVPKLDKAEWEAHIIVHYESFPEERDLEEALEAITELGMKPGIAISPETYVSTVRYFTDTIKHFTILSVEPGKQGNPFLPQTYDRVKTLREMAPNAIIEVDGGVNASNAGALIASGADYLVVGSALFETENIKQNYQQIESAGTTV